LLNHINTRCWFVQARGLATEVSAGIDEDGYSQNTGLFLFAITIGLTESGLTAAPGCGLAAVQAAFQYLAMMRSAGVMCGMECGVVWCGVVWCDDDVWSDVV
jgi:secreted Zn-dependent insulinase-like peptidase